MICETEEDKNVTKQAPPPEEHMVLLYKKVDRLLYGYIAFYKKEQAGQETASKPYRESSPFVIGRYSTKSDGKLEVLGSVVFLLGEIRRSINGFVVANNAWNAERSRLTKELEVADCDLRYDQKAMDFVILVSTHARNLFDLMPRFNDKSIPRLDYHGSADGEVTLRELFDILIHNRYYYFDGTRIRDLFSGEFKKKKSALSGRFMGYGFNILDFVQGISDVIEDVKVKDLTQLLWGRFTDFSADSKPQDIVLLAQNVQVFSNLLKAKIPTTGYQFMMSLMFDEFAGSVGEAGAVTMGDGTLVQTQQVIFESPSVRIARQLNRKELEIRVRCAVGVKGQPLSREDLKDHSVTVGFEEFFRKVNQAFGDDRVLIGTSRRFVSAAMERSRPDASV